MKSGEFESMDLAFHKQGRFRHISINRSHVAGSVEALLDRFRMTGWEITSVIVWDNIGQTETVSTIDPYCWKVAELFWELDSHPYMCEKAVAFLLAFGWAEWDGDSYSERCFGEFANPEEFAIQNISIYHFEGGEIDIPDLLEVDWAATARNIETEEGYTFQRHNGSLFAFRNN